jgi:predicted nucleotidyltransferase component of viral defense system
MMDLNEIRRRARLLGIDQRHVEGDYVLNHLLAALAEQARGVILRGGTALARIYWPDFRLSEDIDLIAEGSIDTEFLQGVVGIAIKTTGLPLRIEIGNFRDGRSRSLVRWGKSELLIDISANEHAFMPPVDGLLALPYRDLRSAPRRMLTMAHTEILGNKWFMLSDRREPRDLYDIWAGLQRDVAFEEIAAGHQATYAFRPTSASLSSARALKPLWEGRLAHQIGNLPAFDEVHQAVSDAFESWRGRA